MANKLTYEEWKRQVNACVHTLTGLDADDLPDFAYRDAYEAGRTPAATARAVFRAARDR